MCCTKKWKYEQWIDIAFFILGFVGYSITMFLLFNRQVWGNDFHYPSDMKAYILEMLGENTTYSFPYPVFFKLGSLFHLVIESPELCIAIAATVLNSMSTVVMKYYMNKSILSHSSGQGHKKQICLRLLITVAVFSLFFVSMIYLPDNYNLPGINFKYAGVFSPNPHHNATYMAARPFAIVAFFLFANILCRYEKETNWKENLLFGLFLLLATLTKPSFTFVLVPTAGLILLFRLIRNKFQNFCRSLYVGICFVPTFIVLLYQFFGVFGSSGQETRGIGFEIARVWSRYSDNIFFSVCLAAAAPIVILLFHIKELKEKPLLLFSWQLFGVSILETLLLYEKGFREKDFNFSWGYMHGLFFVFTVSLIVLLQETICKKKKMWIVAFQWGVYGMHLICGVWYFRGIFLGGAWR